MIVANNVQDLQKSLELLHIYCTNWGLQVNTEKTKIVVFRKRGRLKDDESWTYNGVSLEVVNDFFCSGIQFNLLLSPYPCFISLLYLDLYVLGDDALIC